MPRTKKLTLKKKMSKKKPVAMTKLIRKVIRRYAEKKQLYYDQTANLASISNTSTTVAGNIWHLTPYIGNTYGPTINRGSANNQFLGNDFRITKYTFDLTIYPALYNATTNNQSKPYFVRLYFFKVKKNPVTAPPVSDFQWVAGNFFEAGGTNQGFYGSLIDLSKKISTENYTYLTSRTYKVGPAAPATGSGSTAYHIATNNDFKLAIFDKINLTKYFKTPIKVNDANQTMTPWVFCLAQIVSATGEVTNTSQRPIDIQSVINVSYTDV